MTDPCRDWRGALGAAALGGIDPTEEIGLRAHLDGCADCRAELRELTAVARALAVVPLSAVDAAPAEPSGALATRVLERLAHERGAVRARRTRRMLITAGVVTSVAAALIAVVLVVGGGSSSGGTRVVMAGVGDEGKDATATATIRSVRAATELDVKISGLPPGGYYWMWVTGADGRRIPAGTFRGSDRPTEFRLTAAVPLEKARRIWVTDGPTEVVLDARLPAST